METTRMNDLEIEPMASSDFGPCECCGHNSRRVWGLVRTPTRAIASYFVHWTLDRVHDHGAHFDLIIGKRGDRSSAKDRVLVSVEYRVLESGPWFMVVNSANRDVARSDLVGKALSRSQVIGKPIAKKAFAIVDAILDQDPRVAELDGE